jgi:hypothetical protein
MAQALIRVFLLHSSLAGLVVFAERLNPIPSRTRPLNFPAPMVLSLKAWKSRSLPGLPRTRSPQHDNRQPNGRQQWRPFGFVCFRDVAPSSRPAFPSHVLATATSPLPQQSVCPHSPAMVAFSRGFMTGSRNRSFCALPIAVRRCYIAPETRGQCTALRVLARGGAAR